MRKAVKWTTDEHGLLRGLSLHDGALVRMDVGANSQQFVIEGSDGREVELRALGIRCFSIVEYWNGAIVSDVFAWPANRVPESVWNLEDGAWPALVAGRATGDDAKKFVHALINENPAATMLQVLCSYGGSFATLCDSLEIFIL